MVPCMVPLIASNKGILQGLPSAQTIETISHENQKMLRYKPIEKMIVNNYSLITFGSITN